MLTFRALAICQLLWRRANLITSVLELLTVATSNLCSYNWVWNEYSWLYTVVLILVSATVTKPFFYNQHAVFSCRIMRKPLRGIARAMLFCMGFHWVKVKGKLSSSEEAPILTVAPHSSFIDALALSVICLPSGVSRKENDSIPLVGG